MTDDPTAVLPDPALDEVAGTLRALYRQLGNRPAFDSYLHPDITIWESDAPELIGLAGLDALREGFLKFEESVQSMQAGQASDRYTIAAPRGIDITKSRRSGLRARYS